MEDWLKPHGSVNALGPDAQDRQDCVLRLMDLALVAVAIALLLVLWPLVLLAASLARRESQTCIGAKGCTFERVHWRLGTSWAERVLIRLGAQHWPSLWAILRGYMAWVGPRPRPMTQVPRRVSPVRPGLVSLHALRRLTAVDFLSEDYSDSQYLQGRGLLSDLRLLLLYGLNALLATTATRHAQPPQRVRILDVWVDNLGMDAALDWVERQVAQAEPAQISFVNSDCANIAAKRASYRRDLADSSLVLPDGIGMKLASRWLGTPLRQNVNGTDFFPRLCERLQANASQMGARVYLLGAREEVVQQVAQVMAQRWPKLVVVGAHQGYVQPFEEVALARDIRESGAQLLLVAMGAPLQEAFIARNRHRLGHCVAIGVGGLFDFVAGRVERAPLWMRDAGLEWVWRLIQEPARMWRRYLVGNLTFVARVLLQKAGLRNPQEAPSGLVRSASGQECSRAAVILATQLFEEEAANSPLAASLPLGPANFVETTLASLSLRQVRCVHIVTPPDHPGADALKAQLGDGSRWGAQITWHESMHPLRPFEPLKTLAQVVQGPTLLIAGHCWIGVALQERLLTERQVAVGISRSGHTVWRGWACLEPADLAQLSDCRRLKEIGDVLYRKLTTQLIVDRSEFACASDDEALVHAQRWAHAQDLAALQTEVWLQRPWGFVSAHAHVASDAQIEGPAWIGPCCVVRSGAQLGPNVNLTANVVVDRGARLENAVVLPDTYVGPEHSTPGHLVGNAPAKVLTMQQPSVPRPPAATPASRPTKPPATRPAMVTQRPLFTPQMRAQSRAQHKTNSSAELA